ncbi:beta/alpha barrel domain-containing protein [Aliiroseovarius halocynthiae]|uniref:Uncharacterized protein n=1 Tax=Aliiroseovarius halocynthiae TaxID=985055 RepID=A0A545SQH0_9RHOB|nr:hypothetical protein [Aliiroseovarius halocynthiae]TQV67204.1 hypothetical protein FIL88_11530 [Aliiroseovarius halocynthiae]
MDIITLLQTAAERVDQTVTVDAISLPVNVMMPGDPKSIESTADLGVARAIYGPSPYVTTMSEFQVRFRALD